MDYDTIFASYYNLYRAEAEAPSSSDDEYTIGMRLANNAIRRWYGYDNTMWKEMWTDTGLNGTGATLTTTAGTPTYTAPTAFNMPGGFVQLRDSAGKIVKHVPVVNVEDVQFLSQNVNAAYFTGDPKNGYTLRFIDAPDVTGRTIYYPYYKNATLITAGATKPEMSDPEFVVHSMLQNRFRASRNPYYGTAKQEAADILTQMKMRNDSGSWSNPWSLQDRSGTVFGEGSGTSGWSW